MDAVANQERLRTIGRGLPIVIANDEALERLADRSTIDDPDVAGIALPDVPPSPAGPA